VTWLSWVGMASDQGDGEEVTDAQMDFLNPTPHSRCGHGGFRSWLCRRQPL